MFLHDLHVLLMALKWICIFWNHVIFFYYLVWIFQIHFVGIYWYIRERVSQLRNNWLWVLLLCEHFGAKSLKELSPLECVDVIVRYSREPRREGGGGGWWHSLRQEASQEHPAVQDLCHHHQKRAGSSVWWIGEWKNSISILFIYGTQRVIVHSFLRRINGYGHF